MRERICIFLRTDCASFEPSKKRVMNYQPSRRFEIPMTVSYSNNGQYVDHDVDEDFPPDGDQGLFSLVNRVIYLKCKI